MIALFLVLTSLADVASCACDVAHPASLEARECSLCKAAEQQPADLAIFFLKDSNPSKPNRTLALPRKHYPGPHSLYAMPAADQTVLWTAAIAKAKELWGDRWALAYNGEERRTQCHGHIHIGQMVSGLKDEDFAVVDSPAEIAAPQDGSGLWVHPVQGKLHVHAGQQVTEFNLMR